MQFLIAITNLELTLLYWMMQSIKNSRSIAQIFFFINIFFDLIFWYYIFNSMCCIIFKEMGIICRGFEIDFCNHIVIAGG